MRVLDINAPESAVARATTELTLASGAVFVRAVAERAVVFAGRVFCAPAVLRDVKRCVPRTVVAAERGDKTPERDAVVRTGFVEIRDCVCVGADALSPLVRGVDVPSRTAPLAMPMQTKKFTTKARILFISDGMLANL